MKVTIDNIANLSWQKMDNLLPAIVQDNATGEVLMQGYMNPEALNETLLSNKATFFSRSKQRLWVKGESSGHILKVSQVITDCDQDSLLILAQPMGPTCHLGTQSCFVEQNIAQQNFLPYLEQFIAKRKSEPVEKSYTARLLAKGTTKVAQKVGEEGVEVALAAVAETKEDLLGECADLFYHTLVLLQDKGVTLCEVMEVLQTRHKN